MGIEWKQKWKVSDASRKRDDGLKGWEKRRRNGQQWRVFLSGGGGISKGRYRRSGGMRQLQPLND